MPSQLSTSSDFVCFSSPFQDTNGTSWHIHTFTLFAEKLMINTIAVPTGHGSLSDMNPGSRTDRISPSDLYWPSRIQMCFFVPLSLGNHRKRNRTRILFVKRKSFMFFFPQQRWSIAQPHTPIQRSSGCQFNSNAHDIHPYMWVSSNRGTPSCHPFYQHFCL